MKNIRIFVSENFQFLEVKASRYLNRRVFVMYRLFFIVLGLTTREALWIILCRLPMKGRKEIEEEMKERNREERDQE